MYGEIISCWAFTSGGGGRSSPVARSRFEGTFSLLLLGICIIYIYRTVRFVDLKCIERLKGRVCCQISVDRQKCSEIPSTSFAQRSMDSSHRRE